MPSSHNDNPSHRRFLGKSWLALAALALSNPALGALREAVGTRGELWGWIIIAIVGVFTLLSAALPLAASKQWQGAWRLSALLTLAVLGIWIGVIILSRLQDGDAHALWPMEIFAWAMLNMIYMVVLFTIKRILAKADEQAAESPE